MRKRIDSRRVNVEATEIELSEIDADLPVTGLFEGEALSPELAGAPGAGDAKGAISTLEHAYALGHDAEIAAHWGEVLWVSGRRGEARRVWAAALAREPESKPLKATLKRFLPDAK